jgi:sugar (pentulose or hexulose) kinase
MDVVIGIDTGTTATKAVAAGLGADVNAARKLTPFRPAATRGHFSGGADTPLRAVGR